LGVAVCFPVGLRETASPSNPAEKPLCLRRRELHERRVTQYEEVTRASNGSYDDPRCRYG
jgi:hypothetical protein